MAQKRVVEEIEVDLVEEEDMIDGAEKALVLAGNVDVKKTRKLSRFGLAAPDL